MLVAENLLLCLTDDTTGKLLASGTEVDVALGGALLVELALREQVDIGGSDDRVRKGRLVVRDASPTGDDVLDEALAAVVANEGKKPGSVVTKLGKKVRPRLYDRLVAAGLLRAEEGRFLGIFPTRRWPTVNPVHESAVRARLAGALRAGTTGDAHAAALISLLAALNAVHKAVDPVPLGLTRRELRGKSKKIAEGEWAGKAVKQAIDAMNAATVAVISASAAAGGGGS